MGLFADKVIHKKYWNWVSDGYSKAAFNPAFDSFAPKLFTARVVTLDNAAAVLAHQLSLRLSLAEIHNNLRFLRLPCDRMWYEVSRQAFFENPTLEPGRVGYLLERTTETGFTISVVEEMLEENQNGIIPIIMRYHFDSDFSQLEQENPLRLSLQQKMRYGFGFGYSPDPDGLDLEIRYLCQHLDIRFLNGFYVEQFKKPEHSIGFHETLNEMAGTVRHVLAFLLLTHFPPVQLYARKPQQGRRIVNGQSRPYLKVEDLHITWPKRKPINVLRWVKSGLPKEPAHKRAHDVDGHWRRLRPLTDTEIDELGKPRWMLAPHEFYKHTWVHDHQRGDARLGFVHKRKRITA